MRRSGESKWHYWYGRDRIEIEMSVEFLKGVMGDSKESVPERRLQ